MVDINKRSKISLVDKYVTNQVIKKRKSHGKWKKKKQGVKKGADLIGQAELARLLNVSNQFISHVEHYRRKYSVEQINQLAKIFKCSPQYFIPKRYIEDKSYIKNTFYGNLYKK